MTQVLLALLLLLGFLQACRAFTAADLFSFRPEGQPGGCSADQIATISNWISEINQLHQAAYSAYAFAGVGIQDEVHLLTFLGIRTLSKGVFETNNDMTNHQHLASRLSAVNEFITGHGARGEPRVIRPWLFCDDTVARYSPWNQPARDGAGNFIPKPGEQGSLLTAADVFPKLRYQNDGAPFQPFWIDFLNTYVLQGSETGRLCERGIEAITPRSQHDDSINGVQFEDYGVFIVLCPSVWNPDQDDIGSLAETITYDEYPTAGSDDDLDSFVPPSLTLYHELFHLTDYQDKTDDLYMELEDILEASKGNIDIRKELLIDPEPFAYFALASYLARNPPQTPPGSPPKPAVMFFGASPAAAS